MPQVQSEHVALYSFFTLAYLGFIWFFTRQSRPMGINLVLWGILTVVLACGYGVIGHPSLMIIAPNLTKIGFLLVLSGATWCLLAAGPNQSASKEAGHG